MATSTKNSTKGDKATKAKQPTKAELKAQLAETEAEMAKHKGGWKTYQIHRKARQDAKNEADREAAARKQEKFHKAYTLYKRAYTANIRLRKQLGIEVRPSTRTGNDTPAAPPAPAKGKGDDTGAMEPAVPGATVVRRGGKGKGKDDAQG